MIRVRFQDTSFRDGFQSVYGARVFTKDFMPAVEASLEAGIKHFEAGGGARFQSLFFYCNESAFDMMDEFRKTVGPDVELQTLARGINTVCLSQSPKDIIELHAKMFKKHGISIIRNFDALNDMRNLDYSGRMITKHGLHHQIVVTMMDLPPGCVGAHTSEFYLEKVKEIKELGIPYDSICFKDASGTAHPEKVYKTFKGAREILGDDVLLWFHTHDTAGVAVACNIAAIKGGATKDDNMGVCLAKAPVSGGTSQVDILSMWHALKNSGYTIDVDPLKILKASEVFQECMKDYFVPAEAKMVSPVIPLSPMPGGALTANTMMMRDTGTLHLYPQVIKEMSDVVAKGGFGTSVTPVSQFYFQQAFNNVTQGKWTKMADGYANMVLGYFGKTPTEPDAQVVKIASEQLGKPVFTGDPVDVLEPGIPTAQKALKDAGLPVTEENTFISFACKDKGIQFLKEGIPANVRKNVKEENSKTSKTVPTKVGDIENYTVRVDGKNYAVEVMEGTGDIKSVAPKISSKNSGEAITASLPGNVVRVEVEVGDSLNEGDVIVVLEAMKMETPVKASKAGVIASVDVAQGDVVQNGDTLITLE